MTAQDWYVRDAGAWRSVLGTFTPAPPPPPADPDDPSDPSVTSWQDAWNTQNYNTILGWYNANAGLLDPSALQPKTTGQLFTSTNGQVIENRDIEVGSGVQKCVNVMHNNVTVRNCRLTANGDSSGIWVDWGVTGTKIENCDINGTYPSYGTSRSNGNYGNLGIMTRNSVVHIRFCRIYGVRQGMLLHPFTLAEYNRVFDLHVNVSGVSTSSYRTLSENASGFNYNGGTTVRRNMGEAGSSHGIGAYAQGKPVRDCEWYENLVVGVGRAFGIRGGQVVDDPNRFNNRDIRINDNRFHGVFAYPTVLGEGTNAGVRIDQPGSTFDRNRWLGSNVDIPARCGVTQDDCH